MAKYYFSDNDEEMCYTIAAHKQQMLDNGETERVVFEAIKSEEKNWFYCRVIGEVGANELEGGNQCGKECDLYEPRNGKSGCCKSFRNLYTSSEKSKVIKLKSKPSGYIITAEPIEEFNCKGENIGMSEKLAVFHLPKIGRTRYYRNSLNNPNINGLKLLIFKTERYAQKICDITNKISNAFYKVEKI